MEERVVCEGLSLSSKTCDNATFRNSTAACLFNSCGESSLFEESSVECFGRSCEKSRFSNSNVTCGGLWSCEVAEFVGSNVRCDGFEACGGITVQTSAVTCIHERSCEDSGIFGDSVLFDECSCCEGSGCPSQTQSCVGDPPVFCSLVVNGRTCAQRRNPICPFGPELLATQQDTEVVIPPQLELLVGVANPVILPENGGVSPREDGTLIYTPNIGFVGDDLFEFELCDSSGSCRRRKFLVLVGLADIGASLPDGGATLATPESPTESKSSGLYALSALVLIPILVVFAVVWRRKKRESGKPPPSADDGGTNALAERTRPTTGVAIQPVSSASEAPRPEQLVSPEGHAQIPVQGFHLDATLPGDSAYGQPDASRTLQEAVVLEVSPRYEASVGPDMKREALQ